MSNIRLGQTIDDYELVNGETYLSELCAHLRDRKKGAETIEVELGKLHIDEDGSLYYDGERLLGLDDEGYYKLSSVANIPTAYLMRLNNRMKIVNLEYWFRVLSEKKVSLSYGNGELVDVHVGIEIDMLDVLEKVAERMEVPKVFKVFNQTNTTIIDIYDEAESYDTSYDSYYAGLRVLIKKGLFAPEISPMFLNMNTCGIIECSSYLDALGIKGLAYDEIMDAVGARISNCLHATDTLFATYKDMCTQEVENARRRVHHYCEEHNIPERVVAYALDALEEAHLKAATYEDIINLFGSLGYVDEVKQSSERKLQQLAGYIIVSKSEKRCQTCDSILLEE